MKIYTGYFAKLKQYKNPISIARFDPKGISIPRYEQLAPSADLLKWYKTIMEQVKEGKLAESTVPDIYAHYEDEFTQTQLKPIGAEKIVNWLETLVFPDKEVTLICYEKTGFFCHRHIVAKYLKKYGYDIIPEV